MDFYSCRNGSVETPGTMDSNTKSYHPVHRKKVPVIFLLKAVRGRLFPSSSKPFLFFCFFSPCLLNTIGYPLKCAGLKRSQFNVYANKSVCFRAAVGAAVPASSLRKCPRSLLSSGESRQAFWPKSILHHECECDGFDVWRI